ncbi:MAG: VWA domain-containing protein, partial [Actinomycetota bacterium]
MTESGDALASLVGFGRELRIAGLPVGTGRVLTFCRAVAALSLSDRDSLYWAGRASMIGRREDFAAYDEAFDAWYRSLGTQGELLIELTLPASSGTKTDVDWGEMPDNLQVTVGGVAAQWRSAGDDEPEDEEETSIRIVASGVEVLREKSFPDLTEEERARIATMIRRLAVTVPVERTRRTRPASKGTTFDIRRTLRRSLRTQGEPFDRAWRARKSRTRPLVLILDI